MTDPYHVVWGVSQDASDEEIKKAYRALSRKYHPDANINNPNKAQAEEKFKEVTEAYQVLGDEEKKKLYDEFGHAAFQEGFDPEYARRLPRADLAEMEISRSFILKTEYG